MTAPRANSAGSSACASTSAACGSTPWKIPARIRTSSTAPLLLVPSADRNGSSRRQSMGSGPSSVVTINDVPSSGRRRALQERRAVGSGRDLAAPVRAPAARATVAQPEHLERAAGAGPEQRPHLLRLGLLEELLQLVLAHRGLAEPGLDPLHAEGEEHHQ